jgi:glutathione S-transferase
MYTLQSVPDFASLIVHLVLEELGLPYSLNTLDFDNGDLDSPAHRALNPFGKIPAMQTPDGPMFETAAITLWLADRHGALAPVPTAPDRAAFLSWFFFTNFSLHTGMMSLVHPYRAGGEDISYPVSQATRARLLAELGTLDAMIASNQPRWLSAKEPSILTYHLAVLMRWMKAFAYFPDHAIDAADFPAIHAILCAMETRPAAIRAAKDEGLTGTYFSNPES